ncbi:MAG: hypothetical protein LBJ44_07280 [Propionibacteriaceae bacterium]|nr:hypothetical protein [Propionibacteriaceae bacterium]
MTTTHTDWTGSIVTVPQTTGWTVAIWADPHLRQIAYRWADGPILVPSDCQAEAVEDLDRWEPEDIDPNIMDAWRGGPGTSPWIDLETGEPAYVVNGLPHLLP